VARDVAGRYFTAADAERDYGVVVTADDPPPSTPAPPRSSGAEAVRRRKTEPRFPSPPGPACRVPPREGSLGRPLTAREHAFITARGGVLALEAILDTATAATASELEEYLNSD
jgi:hypothetical protein